MRCFVMILIGVKQCSLVGDGEQDSDPLLSQGSERCYLSSPLELHQVSEALESRLDKWENWVHWVFKDATLWFSPSVAVFQKPCARDDVWMLEMQNRAVKWFNILIVTIITFNLFIWIVMKYNSNISIFTLFFNAEVSNFLRVCETSDLLAVGKQVGEYLT